MAKIAVILDCKVGNNVAGDKVELDEKLANELISIGRATLVGEVRQTTTIQKKKPKKEIIEN